MRQSDTYHAIAHQLGSWADRLEKAAYKAIGVEQDCERKLGSAKSDRVQEKRWTDYEKAAEAAEKAITLYEDFSYLYRCILAELNVFDSNGNLRDRQQAEEGVKVVETAGRSPKPLMPILKDAGIKVIHKMTSIRHAASAQKLGVDAVTLIGFGSGGHIGMDNVASFIMIPMAVSRLDIPVIAGGGVADGKGFLGALAMGAEAVLMGTAFFATQECPAHEAIKERLVQTQETDTCLLLNSIHNPIRCVKNKLADECLALEEKNASFEEIITAVAGGKGKLAYDSGDTEVSPIACGQIVGAIKEVKTVQQLIDDIVNEADALMKRLNVITA